MLVVVALVRGMPVPIVQVVNMVPVLCGFVAAPGAVLMTVFVVCLLVLSLGLVRVNW